MNEFQEFIDQHKDETEFRPVNLTYDQVEAINNISDMLDLSFADTVMILLEMQLSDIGGAFLSQFMQAQAKRN